MRGRIGAQLDASSKEMFDIMLECASRIDRMTHDLLALARIDREASGSVQPGQGLLSAVRILTSRAIEHVDVQTAVETQATLEGRAGQLNHVFIILLDNALRAVASDSDATPRNGAWQRRRKPKRKRRAHSRHRQGARRLLRRDHRRLGPRCGACAARAHLRAVLLATARGRRLGSGPGDRSSDRRGARRHAGLRAFQLGRSRVRRALAAGQGCFQRLSVSE